MYLLATIVIFGILNGFIYQAANLRATVTFFSGATANSLLSFCSLMVSCGYVDYRKHQSVKIERRMTRALSTNIDKDEVDFEAFISTSPVLKEFMLHLARENEINYLVVKYWKLWIVIIIHCESCIHFHYVSFNVHV